MSERTSESEPDRVGEKSLEGQARILVVEDDASLAQWISEFLVAQGFEVSIASRGDTAINLIEQNRPDLVVLDIMLPVHDGFYICKKVRQFYFNPILMLTACDEEAEEVRGLDLGANDYLTKPVRPKILLARIKSLLRTIKPSCDVLELGGGDVDWGGDKIDSGGVKIDRLSRHVYFNEEKISISDNEFDVLLILAENYGRIVSRDVMLKQLRGFDYDGFDRSIDIRISRLRKKLQDIKSVPVRIKTVRAQGYILVSES